MWPMRPEMSRDECRKCLRCLELEAYGNMVSVLRAQGPFTNEKQKLLQELAKVLHISNERHRAEVRRAVNDEKLATIAEQLNGPNTGIDWTLEGRRTIPLLPRLKARSAFTTLANSLSLTTAIANEKIPDRCNRQSGNSTAAETESHSNIKMKENLSVDTKLNSFENDLDKQNELDNSKTSQENSNLTEDERIDNKNVLDKVSEKSEEFSRKRKSPSPLPTMPPNKVLVVSEPPNHISWTSENKQASQVLQVTKQNFALITVTGNEISDSKESTTLSGHSSECVEVPLNKHVVTTTTSTCTNNASNPKTVVSTEQNKISTKVVPAVSSVLSINKVHSSKVTQPQDSTSMPAVSSVLSINKVHSSKVTQPQDSTSMPAVSSVLSINKVHSSKVTQPQDSTSMPAVSSVLSINKVHSNKVTQPQDSTSMPVVSSVLSINKVHSSKVTQPQDSTNNTQKTQVSNNISSNSPVKSSITPIMTQSTKVSSPRLTQSMSHTMPVYPGTTVSSGPGPPQVKQVPIALMCKKLPSEQIVTFDHQSTAKTGIFPKKIVNMPHYTNTKLNKTNVIVIQKAKAVTLSHAGKEVLGKVIMGGKNLCVTSQHNANSINVQPHHISLNNGDQTKTMLPIANSSQNAESVKTNIKSGKATVMSVITHVRHDVPENRDVLSQLFNSPTILNVESKTVIQDANARLPKEECNSDKNMIDRESSPKTDAMNTSEEKQHKKNNDINASSMNQIMNLLESSKSLGSKEILVRSNQVHDDVEDDIRIEKPGKHVDAFDATLESINKNLQSFQYLVDNDKNRDLEKSSRSIVAINQMDKHDDS